VANVDCDSLPFPEDREALQAFVQELWREREQHRQRAEEQQHQIEEQRNCLAEQQRRTEEQQQQAAQLQAEILRLQVELERYKRWYYGSRADRLRTPGELAQLLLNFAEELDRKPVSVEDREPSPEPGAEPRRVQRRKG